MLKMKRENPLLILLKQQKLRICSKVASKFLGSLILAHAVSLGYTGDGKSQIHNVDKEASGTPLKKVTTPTQTRKINVTLKKK
jgi:hypothetical protein